MLGWLAAGFVPAACSARKSPPAAASGPPAPPAFWVWHRSSSLTEIERATLRHCGVERLYWQAAESEWRDGRWHAVEIARHPEAGGAVAIVPVFRLKPNPRFLGEPGTAAALARQVTAWAKPQELTELQLDFDCPDRVLGEYARFLTDLGHLLAPARISITALVSWPAHPQFERLATAVSGLVPMGYDLEPDTAAAVRSGRFQPLAADPEAWLDAWRKCPAPWYAGLPNFERVSVFEADGSLRGHVRGWTHDELLFHPFLLGKPMVPGVTRFEVTAPARLAGTPLVPGQRVIWRTVPPDTARALTDSARAAGARGVIWFALPGPGIQAAYSASHLTAAPGERVELRLTATADGGVMLANIGRIDLPGQALDPATPGERGWALVLRAPNKGAFRSGGVGEFMLARPAPGLTAEDSAVLALRFPRLPAGATLRSGRCLATPDAVRWQIPGATAELAIR